MFNKEDLLKYGISGTTEVVYNPSYETLFEEKQRQASKAMKLVKTLNLVQ